MRKRVFQRNLAWVVSLGGAVAIALAACVPDALMTLTVRSFLFCFGLLFFFGAAMLAWFTHQAIRAQAALLRGEGVLARWQVDAATAQAFLASKHDYEEGPPPRYNEFTAPKVTPPNGFQVIVGKEAILIGDSIQVLPRRSTPEVTLAGVYSDSSGGLFAYLRLYYPPYSTRNSTHPPRHTMLRFPVASAALAQAQVAMTYYNDGRPGEPDFFHGPGDGTNPEDLSVCIACGYKTHALKSHCPQCGAGLQSRRWSRRFGFVLVLCGIILSSGIGILLYKMTPILLNPGKTINGTTFNGTPAQAWLILGMLSAVMIFGLFALVYGTWQRLTGGRSAWAIAVALAFWSVFMMIPWFLQ